jgi:hypothetical protein
MVSFSISCFDVAHVILYIMGCLSLVERALLVGSAP